MFLSVIIPTYNRQRDLGVALISLARQNFPKNGFEIIVVDDGSNPAVTNLNWPQDLDLKIVRLPHHGVSAARNRGLDEARGEGVVFFDDDALADTNWLKTIDVALNSDAAITGKVLPKKRKFWRHFAPHYDQGERIRRSPVILEGNCAFLKKVFNAVGRFDENLDYGHEGRDFLGRLEEKFVVNYHPEIIIYHDYAAGFGHYLKKQYKFGQKMIYLQKDKIRGLNDIVFHHKKIKSTGQTDSETKKQIISWAEKIMVKIVARIGEAFHYFGALSGWFKYVKKSR